MILDLPEELEEMYELVDAWTEMEEAQHNPETLDPYELSKLSGIHPQKWKEFLILPQVDDQLKLDLRLQQRQKIALLTKELSSDSKSTGVAQLLNTMMNSYDKKTATREAGPAFIYVFVPLTPEQKESPNAVELDYNPFVKEGE